MPRLLTALIVLFSFLFVFAFSVSAATTTSKDFYDYGLWYYKGAGRVLAEATTSSQASESAVPASTQTSESSASADQAEIRKPSGLLPDSPFYFVKPFAENINLTFTFDAKAKDKKRLDLSEERLAETKSMIEKKKYDVAARNFKRYKDTVSLLSTDLQNLKDKNISVEDLAKEIELNTARHSLVLEKLDLQSPDELDDDIIDALDASQKGMDVSADVLGRDPIPADLKERLESLKALGVLPEGEVSAIFTLSSREDVRKELDRLAQQDLLPDADVKRMDEAQFGYFPADFLRISEVRKIFEYKKLEELKPDDATQKKIAEFAATYKPGEAIPSDLKKWWVPLQRYQELQATLRPDLVVNTILPRNSEDYKRFEGIFDKFKPNEDQLKLVEKWGKDNPGKIPPPEIQRIASLAINLGAVGANGSNFDWKPNDQFKNYVSTGFPGYYPPPAGFSGPNDCKNTEECKQACEKDPSKCGSGFGSGQSGSGGFNPQFGNTGGFRPYGTLGGNIGSGTGISGAPGAYCLETETKGKNAFSGEIKVFPNSCLPSNWYPYFGSEKAGEVSRPTSLPFNQPPYNPGGGFSPGAPGTSSIYNPTQTPGGGCSGGAIKDPYTGNCRCPDGQYFADGACKGASNYQPGSTYSSPTNSTGSTYTSGSTYNPTPTSGTPSCSGGRYYDTGIKDCRCPNNLIYKDGYCQNSTTSSTSTTPTSGTTSTSTNTSTATEYCALPNATGRKEPDGRCVVVSCSSGFSNNNARDDDGCEVNNSTTGTTSGTTTTTSPSPSPSPTPTTSTTTTTSPSPSPSPTPTSYTSPTYTSSTSTGTYSGSTITCPTGYHVQSGVCVHD